MHASVKSPRRPNRFVYYATYYLGHLTRWRTLLIFFTFKRLIKSIWQTFNFSVYCNFFIEIELVFSFVIILNIYCYYFLIVIFSQKPLYTMSILRTCNIYLMHGVTENHTTVKWASSWNVLVIVIISFCHLSFCDIIFVKTYYSFLFILNKGTNGSMTSRVLNFITLFLGNIAVWY